MAEPTVTSVLIRDKEQEVKTRLEKISKNATWIVIGTSSILYLVAACANFLTNPPSYLVAVAPYCSSVGNYIIGTYLFGVIIKSSEYISVFSKIIEPKIGNALKDTGERHKNSTEEILIRILTNPTLLCQMPSLENYWNSLTVHEIQRRYPSFDATNIADKVFKKHVQWDRPYLLNSVSFEYEVERVISEDDKKAIAITEVSFFTIITDQITKDPTYHFEWEAEEAGTVISDPTWDIQVDCDGEKRSLLNGNNAVPAINGKYCITYPLAPNCKYYISRKVNIKILPESGPHWYCTTMSYAMNFTVKIVKTSGVEVNVHYEPDLFSPMISTGKAYRAIRPVFPGEGFHLIFR